MSLALALILFFSSFASRADCSAAGQGYRDFVDCSRGEFHTLRKDCKQIRADFERFVMKQPNLRCRNEILDGLNVSNSDPIRRVVSQGSGKNQGDHLGDSATAFQEGGQFSQEDFENANSGISASDALANNRLDTSEAYLNRMASESGGPDNLPPQQRQAYYNDSELVSQLRARSQRGEKYSLSEANLAKDPFVRETLQEGARAQEVKDYFKEEAVRLDSQAQALRKMQQQVEGSKDRLTRLGEDDSFASRDQQERDSSASLAAGTESRKRQNGRMASPEDGKEKSTSLAAGAAKGSKEPDGRLLRELLRRKLAEKLKGKGGADDSFEDGSLDPPEPGMLASVDENAPPPPGTLDLRNLSDAFSLAGSETDAEVRRMLEAAERDLASLKADGVLGSESASLFERVHLAHENCQRSKCVAFSPAP